MGTLTVAKLALYRHYAGDLDGWARHARDGARKAIDDADWALIDELLLGLELVAREVHRRQQPGVGVLVHIPLRRSTASRSAALRSGPTDGRCEISWQQPDADQHRAAVLACLDAIGAGEIYQACVCTQYTGTAAGSPLDFFADAVARTTPARAAYLAGDWGAVASLSPELFLRRVGEDVHSSPIKGTLPLHADPELLRASAKDVAENIMIVDLVRNDLGRVARTGSVTVPELLAVHPAPGVWHLVSTVSARVPAKVSTADLLAATFPPASVTGTPKSRARQLLSQWEPHRRGVYCGTVGLASPAAGCELNVAIRTVEFDAASRAVLGVGGGITADSDPAAEWQECLDKAAAIVHSPASMGAGPPGRARSTAS